MDKIELPDPCRCNEDVWMIPVLPNKYVNKQQYRVYKKRWNRLSGIFYWDFDKIIIK